MPLNHNVAPNFIFSVLIIEKNIHLLSFMTIVLNMTFFGNLSSHVPRNIMALLNAIITL